MLSILLLLRSTALKSKMTKPHHLRPAVTTAVPASMETTGIGVNALRGSPAQTAGSVSVDLFDHFILSVFCPILPYVQAAAVGPENV